MSTRPGQRGRDRGQGIGYPEDKGGSAPNGIMLALPAVYSSALRVSLSAGGSALRNSLAAGGNVLRDSLATGVTVLRDSLATGVTVLRYSPAAGVSALQGSQTAGSGTLYQPAEGDGCLRPAV